TFVNKKLDPESSSGLKVFHWSHNNYTTTQRPLFNIVLTVII
ncbi:MAG: hypothetical protein ACI8WA_001333, partial [Polaribacter sp.]